MNSASSAIVASSYCVPTTRLSDDELVSRFGEETMEKVRSNSGIHDRRVAGPEECASDLALQAAEELFAANPDVSRESIDLLVFATQTPDYLLPTTACILQDKLGLPKSTAAFDVNLGCSQYVYSVSVAHAMITSGLAKRALVLTGDTVSRILHPLDRMVVPLFGDAGTASLIEAAPEGQGFRAFEFGTDGSGHELLVWPTSGMRVPRSTETAEEHQDKYGNIRRRDDMFMDGTAIFVFTLKTVPQLVGRLLNKAGISIEEVDLFVFHQASRAIVEASAKKLNIPEHKLHYKLREFGNSGGSTVGIALTDAWLEGRLRPGMRVVLAAFGVGLSWAATLIEWPEQTRNPACSME